jgi:hypothetical protein
MKMMLLIVFIGVVFSLDTIKLPSAKHWRKCLNAKGLEDFTAKSDRMIRLYANKEIYPTSIGAIVRQIRMKDVMECLLLNVPETDIERITRMIDEETCS